MENFLAILSGLYNRDAANIRVFIITLIAFAITSGNDILKFKVHMGDFWANILYFVLSFIVYYILVVIYELLFVHRQVKIIPSQNQFPATLPQNIEGLAFYAGLDIVIPKIWTIIDCYMTLDKIEPIFYQNRILIKKEFSELLAPKPEYRALKWKSPLSNDGSYKINIGEISNFETILVGKLIRGKAKDPNGLKADICTFDFCLCSTSPDTISFHPLGLYKIALTFYWNRNGIKRKKYFKGFIYSEINGGASNIYVREGDPDKYQNIPKPIIKE